MIEEKDLTFEEIVTSVYGDHMRETTIYLNLPTSAIKKPMKAWPVKKIVFYTIKAIFIGDFENCVMISISPTKKTRTGYLDFDEVGIESVIDDDKDIDTIYQVARKEFQKRTEKDKNSDQAQ